MQKHFKFIKLDFLSIKPYLASYRLLLFVVVSIISGVTNNSPMISVSMILFLVMTYATYPFATSDQNNLDILYMTLGYDRKDVVKGRYLTMFSIYLVAIIIETLMYILVSLITKSQMSIMNLIGLNIVIRLLMILVQAIQFPIYFKEGYLKAKTSTYLPYLVIISFSVIFYALVNNQIIDMNVITQITKQNTYLISIVIILLTILSIYLSYRISVNKYSRREF